MRQRVTEWRGKNVTEILKNKKPITFEENYPKMIFSFYYRSLKNIVKD